MNPNLSVLVELCQEKNVPYTIVHESGNLVEVKSKKGEPYLFTIVATPFNCQSIETLCRDKEFFYDYYRETIQMPKTQGFVKPTDNEKWESYVKFPTIKAIIKEVEQNFSYPFIAKMNRGLQGKCVFKVTNQKELRQALTQIYQKDYVALIQDYINIQAEYRLLYLQKKLMFAYKKNNENAVFTGNLSPLHWQGAFAEIVENKELLKQFDHFIQPMLNKKNIPFCGLDIAIDQKENLWLIEGNCSPGFGYFLQNPKGIDLLKHLYLEMLKSLDVLE